MKVARLPLKRCFWPEILSGRKKFEYRSKTPYFDRLLAKEPKLLVLHSYSSDFIITRIRSVRLIKSPGEHADVVCTNVCYALELEAPTYFKNRQQAKSLMESMAYVYARDYA